MSVMLQHLLCFTSMVVSNYTTLTLMTDKEKLNLKMMSPALGEEDDGACESCVI